MTYVNCRKVECTHYCGRPDSLHKAIGEPEDLSILGNPFVTGHRLIDIRNYSRYLLEKIRRHQEWRDLILAIPDDAKLGCFCYPRECHCQQIILAKKYIQEEYDSGN